ncbi:MAG: MarR family transcriptional regulator [Alphaproteobacteria bacterium]|nr:MarR family winged helix-turn-helix transcriptional regulator [Alphaproteobacteria bacterium]MDE2109944.1 MarR family transcriptional regulator [Alphaproteobacteria bacterium]
MPSDRDALRQAIDEIRACFADLRAVSDTLTRHRRVTTAMRAVLEYLCRAGPATVPQIAREKRHKRQSIQEIVNALQAQGLIALRHNPAHSRSRLVAASAHGREVFAAILEKEDALLELLAADCGDIAAPLAAMLRSFRATLRKHAGAELTEEKMNG